jgi:uncharacterized RDD family membrane protein YckC
MTDNELESQPDKIPYEFEAIYPSLMNRLQAMFFDFWIIVAITMLLLVNLFDGFSEQLTWLKFLLFFVIVFIYDPVGAMTGGTIGYRTMGLKVVRQDGIRKISLVQAYQRSFVKFILGIISLLTITSDLQKRAIHDKAAGTLVVFKQ